MFSHPDTADRDPTSGQVTHHSAAVAAGIAKLQTIASSYDPQRRFRTAVGWK